MQSNCDVIWNNKQTTTTNPQETGCISKKKPNIRQSQKHKTTETAGHVTKTALKTKANKICVALSSFECFLNGKRMNGEICFIDNALPFCCPNELWCKLQKKSHLANKSESAGMLR